MSLLVLGCSLDMNIWYNWSGKQRLLQLFIATCSFCPLIGVVTMEAFTPVSPSIHIILVLLSFGWLLPVFLWYAMGACLWIYICILHIRVASRWLDSWSLSLTGIRSWSWWRVSVPACDDILVNLLGSVLLPEVIYQTQWHVWAPKPSMDPCPLSQWGSTRWLFYSRCWMWLGLLHPFNLE